jgi:hypothetical protein
MSWFETENPGGIECGSTNPRGNPSCPAAADRSFAPISRCLYKKIAQPVFSFANISLKPNLDTVEKGYFLLQYVMFSQKMKIDVSVCGEKKTLSTENTVRLNRGNTNRVLLSAV